MLSGIKKCTLLDYPGKVATIVFTAGCNLLCWYCHNSEFVLPEKIKKISHDFISENIFFRFLKTRAGFIDGVVICGGEPTIHADLPDFCRKIKEAGFLVKLDTNGSKPEVLKKLLDENLVDYIAMDIKYPLDRYEVVSGRKVDINLYTASIEIIRRRLPEYEFRTTVIKGVHTAEDIENITQTISGAEHYYLQNYRSGNTLNPNFIWESFAEQELEWLRQVAERNVMKCGIRW